MSGIRVIDVVPSGVGGIQTYADSLEKNLEGEGLTTKRIETYTVNLGQRLPKGIVKKILRIFSNARELLNILGNAEENDVLHCHIAVRVSFWENSLYALVARLRGIPYIFHVHSSLLHKEYNESNFLIRRVRRMILTKAARVIALSEYWRKQLLQMEGVPEDKFVVVHNFVDVQSYDGYDAERCREQLDLPLDKNILFSVGRLTERKGFQYLIEAASMVAEEREDFLIVIGGKGHLRTTLENKIKNLGISDFVRLEGFIPEEKLPLWLNAADIFVLPSLRETFPIVMLEALASGKPVIGTKIAAIPEVILSNKFGLLIESANSYDLASNIAIALDKRWDSKRIKEYANQFTWEKIRKKIIGIYEEEVNA